MEEMPQKFQKEEQTFAVAGLQKNGDGCDSEVTVLHMEMGRLQHELRMCQSELQKLQKQLDQSVRLQKSTESYSQDLRLQVEILTAELDGLQKKKTDQAEAETQTEEYCWTDYSYYYSGYYQTAAETEPQKHSVISTTENVTASSQQSDEMIHIANAEEGDDASSSISAILRATAEEALTQTGFVFDESSGMYYDHTTGFYYDSSTQLYYDANTGMYYCYDPDSGKYQFHSRIKLPTVHLGQTDTIQENVSTLKHKRTSGRTEHPDAVDHSVSSMLQEEDDKEKSFEEVTLRKGHRLHSSTRLSHKSSGAHSSCLVTKGGCSVSHRKAKSRICKRLHSDKRKRKKLSQSRSQRECKSCTKEVNSESELEEGEIMGSEGEREHLSSSCSASLTDSPVISPAPDSPVITTHQSEDGWPPCVRVTVVRSPVLQPGSLFILTADAVSTIGRERDMNHAIRIPEMGVSKSHAEVYFDHDQQCYVLVDQGSQNGTVINGSRILQPKVRCDPYPLTHGDEVKLGETVLSFHIHPGTDTCDGCEPGQVRAHLNRHRRNNMGCVLIKENKELQRQRELNLMKLKYGLKNSEYEDIAVLKRSKYKDRAESRRQTVGSEGTFYRDEAPASVHEEISAQNKGRQMLERMGWKSGKGLGKNGGGITEPILLQIWQVQSGLGSVGTLSVDEVSIGHNKKQQTWEQARERFQHAHETYNESPPTNYIKWQPAE